MHMRDELAGSACLSSLALRQLLKIITDSTGYNASKSSNLQVALKVD